MIFDKEVRERQIYLRSIAPKDPAKWTTRKKPNWACDPNLLDRVLTGREFTGNVISKECTCIVCGGRFYNHSQKERNTCFECTQWTTNERKHNKQQLNLFNL